VGLWWQDDFGRKLTPEEKLSESRKPNGAQGPQRQPPGIIQFFLYPALFLFGLGFLASLFGWGN
jgi:hypothetical protein